MVSFSKQWTHTTMIIFKTAAKCYSTNNSLFHKCDEHEKQTKISTFELKQLKGRGNKEKEKEKKTRHESLRNVLMLSCLYFSTLTPNGKVAQVTFFFAQI